MASARMNVASSLVSRQRNSIGDVNRRRTGSVEDPTEREEKGKRIRRRDSSLREIVIV